MKFFNNILLLSVTTCSIATHCMLTTFKSNVKSKIKLVKKCTTTTSNTFKNEIAELKEKLYVNKWWPNGINIDNPIEYLVPFGYPKHVYGYSENNGAGKYYNKALINYTPETLSEMSSLKNARYKDYSGVGVATLAHETSYEEIKCIIKNLLAAGYIPTDKDKKLARLLEEKEGIILPNGKSDLLDRE